MSSHPTLPSPVASAHTQALDRQSGKAAPWLIGLVLLAGAGVGWWQYSGDGHEGLAQAQTSAARPDGASNPNAQGPGASGAGRRGRNGGNGGGPGGGANRPQPVSVAVARRQDIAVTVSAIGTIAAANTAVVRAKVEGELKAIHFREGQTVKAGDLLAQIDPRAFEITLAQVQGQLARDQAQWQNAKLDLARFKDLLSKDGISSQQVDTQDALVRQWQGTVQADQGLVDNARLQLSYTRVTAPISGRVGLKLADLGNVVRPSDPQGLLTIAQSQPVNVVFAVPDNHLARINGQLKAQAPLPVEAWDREQKLKLAQGQVTSTDNAIDPATGTLKLKALFANADGGLFPNQSVNVKLRLSTDQGTLAVPGAAVQRGAQGAFVYVVAANKTVSLRKVQAGASDGDWIGIQGDLKAGDQVVTDGAERLRDGGTVEVITPGGQSGGHGPGGAGKRREGRVASAN